MISEQSLLKYLGNFSGKNLDTIPTSDDSVAVYYYSSGTTGGSKIIEYTHKSMVLMQASMLKADFGKTGKVHLCFLPLGHTASLRYTIKHCICTGAVVVLYDSFWKLRSKLWDEIEKYLPYLKQHIEIINPRILVLLGSTALNAIIGNKIVISKARGQWAEKQFGECKASVIVTFHPAFLMRQPAQKKMAWIDLKMIREKKSKLKI